MKNSDALTEAIKEISKHFPSLLTYLIHERDMFLTKSIYNSPGNKIKINKNK